MKMAFPHGSTTRLFNLDFSIVIFFRTFDENNVYVTFSGFPVIQHPSLASDLTVKSMRGKFKQEFLPKVKSNLTWHIAILRQSGPLYKKS